MVTHTNRTTHCSVEMKNLQKLDKLSLLSDNHIDLPLVPVIEPKICIEHIVQSHCHTCIFIFI